MQACTNADFQVEIRFQSPVSQQYQIQGLVIEQDSTHFIRIDFSSVRRGHAAVRGDLDGNLQVSAEPDRPGFHRAVRHRPALSRVTRLGNRWTGDLFLQRMGNTSPRRFRILTIP